MGRLIQQVGECQLRMTGRSHYFRALVESILYQQLSGMAAGAILRRFRALYPSHCFPSPEEILATSVEQLRSAGLSRQKIDYLKDLSHRAQNGLFPLRRIAGMEDEAVIRHLTQVKGIGQWTAEMFLIFCLGRPDILPLTDLGIQKAVQKAYDFKALPASRTLERLGHRWKPYRSIASWYLWASVDGVPGKMK
jgi:3-methyladenine DNA glycosylase/8-oxoguanine DNA glycosylase